MWPGTELRGQHPFLVEAVVLQGGDTQTVPSAGKQLAWERGLRPESERGDPRNWAAWAVSS